MGAEAQRNAPDAAPVVPLSTPHNLSAGNHLSQVDQRIADVLYKMGEMSAKIDNIAKTVDSTKSKVDDIVAWKNKILGGVIVVGVLASVITLVVTKFSDWVTIQKPNQAPAAHTLVAPEPIPPAPTVKPARRAAAPQPQHNVQP